MRTDALVVGSGRIRRRRDKSDLLFRHRLPVAIMEIDAADAPVSILVRRTETAVYRLHDGSHWIRLAGLGPNDPVTPDTFPDLVSGPGASAWSRNPFSRQGRKTGTVQAPTDVRWTIDDDGLRDAERVSEAACRDLRFMDGVLHHRVVEPAWIVSYTVLDALGGPLGLLWPRWYAGLSLDHDGTRPDFWTRARIRIDAVREVERVLAGLPERDERRSVPPVETFWPAPAGPAVDIGRADGMPSLPGLASMPDDILALCSDLSMQAEPDIAMLRDLTARLLRVARAGGTEAHVARRLVSDIALPVAVSAVFPGPLSA
jgi:hypothetical protein